MLSEFSFAELIKPQQFDDMSCHFPQNFIPSISPICTDLLDNHRIWNLDPNVEENWFILSFFKIRMGKVYICTIKHNHSIHRMLHRNSKANTAMARQLETQLQRQLLRHGIALEGGKDASHRHNVDLQNSWGITTMKHEE